MLHRRRWEAQLGLPRNLQKYSRLRSSISSMRFLDTASTLRLAFSRGWSRKSWPLCGLASSNSRLRASSNSTSRLRRYRKKMWLGRRRCSTWFPAPDVRGCRGLRSWGQVDASMTIVVIAIVIFIAIFIVSWSRCTITILASNRSRADQGAPCLGASEFGEPSNAMDARL